MEQLAEHFHRYFHVEPALTQSQREGVFRLRYQVYCEELQFENVQDFPDGLETDVFDPQSLHCLLIHKASGQAAGCFRLILHSESGQGLPFLSICQNRLDDTEWHPNRIALDQFGEISRLAVHGNFRRRQGETSTPIGVMSGSLEEPSSRQYPLVATGLFLASTALAMHVGLQRIYVMMEPRLARLLRSCGIMFKQVGEVMDYHGRRGPFMISRELIHQHLPADAKQLMGDFCRQFEVQIERP